MKTYSSFAQVVQQMPSSNTSAGTITITITITITTTITTTITITITIITTHHHHHHHHHSSPSHRSVKLVVLLHLGTEAPPPKAMVVGAPGNSTAQSHMQPLHIML
jgi:hypothetical protein